MHYVRGMVGNGLARFVTRGELGVKQLYPVVVVVSDGEVGEIFAQNIRAVSVRVHPSLDDGSRGAVSGRDVFTRRPIGNARFL